MGIDLVFHFEDNGSAADFLAKLTGEDWPAATTRPAKSEPAPWEPDEPESDSNGSADPWADQATPKRPERPSKPESAPGAGTLFPASGSYDKDTPNGKRTWQFGLPGAPDCDCGYPSALVTGYKNGKKWQAYWCPVGFGKNYRDKCKFSEFA